MLPKILYIASCGHSGSTLLDSMVAAHPDCFSVGEVIFIHRYAHMMKEKNEVSKFGNECTCGAPSIWECPFWPKVESAMQDQSGMSLKDLNLFETEDVDEYRKQNVALFNAVGEASGAKVIVDSSKSPRRLRLLLRTGAFDITPVHLIRTPKGMVYSHLKKNVSADHFGLKRTALQFTKRTIEPPAMLLGMDYPTVRYDRLVREPEAHLRDIMARVGLEFDPAQLEWASPEKHNIGGNPMRRNSSSELRIDTKWKDGLTGGQKLMIDALTFPGLLSVAGRSIA